MSYFVAPPNKDNDISIVTYPRSGKNWLNWYVSMNTNLKANFSHYSELEEDHQDYDLHKSIFSKPIITVIRDPIECIASINTMEEEVRVEERVDTYISHYNFFLKNARLIFLFEDLPNDTKKIVKTICKEFNGEMNIVSESFEHYKFWHEQTQNPRKIVSSKKHENYNKNIELAKSFDLSEHYRLYNLAKERCVVFNKD